MYWTRTRFLRIAVAFILMLTCIVGAFPMVSGSLDTYAASTDYAAQLIRISTKDNSRNLNISGYSDKSACNTWTTNGEQNENWYFVYVGTNSIGSYYKIINMGTGKLLTPYGYSTDEDTSVVIYGSESAQAQHWYVTAVEQDSYGNDLYYTITNYCDSTKAVTYNASSNTISLTTYSGANTQKWLLNTAGLQGFAGYCTDNDGNAKASTIGGALGEVVEVSTYDELVSACSGDTARTIIITGNISGSGTYTTDSNGRYRLTTATIYIGANKTIIGSYSAHSLYNVYFRTYEGTAYGNGHNIILRNIEISHDSELNNDNIWEFSYGWNFWIDHCTFVGHDAVNSASTGLDDWDKFLNFKGTTDFVTISDCEFGLHEYGVLLGYPADTQEIYDTYNGHPCVTLCDNYYHECITRAPALMRYGYFHSYNNYVVNFDMGYTIYTACKLYAESNYYDAGTGKGSVVNDGVSTSDISGTYPGQYTEVDSTLVNAKYGFTLTASTATACTWNPSSNYTYTTMTADEAKTYCETYSGAQSSRSTMTYATYASTGVPSAGYVTAVTDPWDEDDDNNDNTGVTLKDGADIDTGKTFMLKNVNSGLYMDVEGATAADGTNVQQWGASGSASYNTWKVVDAGDGYYYIYSLIGDGNTYMLDVSYALSANGTNIGIYSYTASDAQLFKFVLNSDGSYTIVTKVSEDQSCVEVINALTSSGANVQEWECNGATCQNWILEYVDDSVPGDVSCDDVVNTYDLVLLKRAVLSGSFDSNQANINADVTGDGFVDTNDIRRLSDYLLGKNVTLEKSGVTIASTNDTSATSKYESDDFVFSGNVYLVGDSTVCNYSGTWCTDYNRYGWGMKLAEQFTGVTVTNLAISGQSSRSFLEYDEYTTLVNSLSEGDYLFIQFGHNDEKTDESTYPGLGTYTGLDFSTLDSDGKNSSGQYSYEWMLLNKYINLALEVGATPVLVTPITRRSSDGQAYYSAHTAYQQAMITLGEEYGIAVIDMTALTTELYTNLYASGGADATAALHCYSDSAQTTIDNTHLSSYGASLIASIIAEQTKDLGLKISDCLK